MKQFYAYAKAAFCGLAMETAMSASADDTIPECPLFTEVAYYIDDPCDSVFTVALEVESKPIEFNGEQIGPFYRRSDGKAIDEPFSIGTTIVDYVYDLRNGDSLVCSNKVYIESPRVVGMPNPCPVLNDTIEFAVRGDNDSLLFSTVKEEIELLMPQGIHDYCTGEFEPFVYAYSIGIDSLPIVENQYLPIGEHLLNIEGGYKSYCYATIKIASDDASAPVVNALPLSGLLKVFSIDGVMIMQTENIDDLNSLPAGIYIIKSDDKTEKYVKRK